jgi:GntR family transcriptional regulator/MocR family aminotransferase
VFLSLDDHGPLHAQLTRALRSAVLEGRLAAGAQLPPSRSLATELGVSRNTVLAAYEQLRAEGFITGKVGAGSFVATSIGVRDAGPTRREPIAPQSRYARRARAVHDHSVMPGRPPRGARFAFQYGAPLVNPALTSAWARELHQAAAYTNPNYPPSPGLPALREAVCDYLGRRRGVKASPDDVLIVAGTQQAITLAARVLLDEGDVVAIEEPQYFAMREVLQMHGATMQPVPVDAEGIVTDALPAAAPQLICVTPSHQFPSGVVMSLRRRLALLDYAERHQRWILEDDYDGEFRYGSEPLAALRSLDRNDRVLFVGTFSKVLLPSLRLGYILMPAGLRDDFIAAKWASDFGSSAIDQAALAHFISSGAFERHLRRSAITLRERRAALLDGLRACSHGRLDIADSQAGMHLVAWLRDRTTARGDAFIARALERGLGLHPITPFYFSPPDRAGLLMGYAALSVNEIRQALGVFEQCLDEEYRDG